MGSLGRIREGIDIQQGPLQIFKRLLSFIGPCEWCILLSHPGQSFGDSRKVFDEFPVVTGEAVEGTHVA